MSSQRFRATAPPPSPHDLNPRRDPPLDFPVRALGELGVDDYQTLGFLCGLEVHQQLSTARKLFCRCPAGRRVTRVDAEVLRHMRPTLSELGQYDGCALMEFKTKKEIVYLLERGSVCTYEMDDTPPFPIDEEAVKVALEVSSLLGLNLVNELHVMRKQYLDGSIPTGFQRTAMIGTDGVVPFSDSELPGDRVLRIRQLTLEEDSCREVSDVGHRITFRTDRLGMPLIETVTEPDLLTPHDAAAGGRLLADIAHASGKVRRGAGAARQDVNVSVAGGRRVEIKGVPSHRVLPGLVHNEAYRQLELLRIRADLERRGVPRDALLMGDVEWAWHSPLVVDARAMLKKCAYPPVRDALARGHVVIAVRLPGFGPVLGHRTQPGITFARELADRVQVIACLEARPFMISSNVLDYGLGAAEWKHLKSTLGATPEDGVVVVWGPEADVDTAAREIAIRARDAFDGVPSETRQAFPDGTTGFERILPGAERMYPDTDTPPVTIPDAWVHDIRAQLAERPWERIARLERLGIPRARAARIVRAPYADLIDALGGDPDVAKAVERALSRLHVVPDVEALKPLLALPAFALENAILRVVSGSPPSSVLQDLGLPGAEQSLDAALDATVAARAEAWTRDPNALLRWAMGRVMKLLRGRVDPRRARERLVERLPA